MNILQINTQDKRGGAAEVAYSLKQELEKRGHETSMFVGRKYSDEKNIKLLNDIRSFSGKVRRKLAYWLANDIDVFSSDRIIKTGEFKKADIIHCHNLHGNYFNLSTLQKISRLKPVVWTFHDMWPITAHCGHAFDGEINEKGFFACPALDIPPAIAWHNEKYLENRKAGIYKNSNFHIITPSKWLAYKVKQSILKDKLLSVIPNGVDTNIFKPLRSDLNKLKSGLGLPLDKKIILSVVKKPDDQWKGLPFIYEVAENYKNNNDIVFINIGRNIGNRHNFSNLPPVNNEQKLAEYYSAADMLLYPSIADNCPLVVLEAMACGLPIVSFATGGVPEIIEHKKTGYVAKHKDVKDLVNGIEYVLELKPAELENMRQGSAEKAHKEFNVEMMTDGYLNIYKILTAER